MVVSLKISISDNKSKKPKGVLRGMAKYFAFSHFSKTLPFLTHVGFTKVKSEMLHFKVSGIQRIKFETPCTFVVQEVVNKSSPQPPLFCLSPTFSFYKWGQNQSTLSNLYYVWHAYYTLFVIITKGVSRGKILVSVTNFYLVKLAKSLVLEVKTGIFWEENIANFSPHSWQHWKQTSELLSPLIECFMVAVHKNMTFWKRRHF